jgi:ribonuclease VapC
MIVDSSAIVAILKDEPEGFSFSKLLDSTPIARLSAASYFECSIVIDKNRDPLLEHFSQ